MPNQRVLRAVVLDDGEMNNLLTVTALQPIAGCVAHDFTVPAEAIEALHIASEPRRQELLRRMNLASGGTAALVAMREEVLAHLRADPALKPLDSDLHHLFGSWFNRGFLQLRRIDWQTPAAVLEKLIRYEAVHEIQGWDDLRRRLAADRRCFGFFHPALPGEPLIFVEVALVERPVETPDMVVDVEVFDVVEIFVPPNGFEPAPAAPAIAATGSSAEETTGLAWLITWRISCGRFSEDVGVTFGSRLSSNRTSSVPRPTSARWLR